MDSVYPGNEFEKLAQISETLGMYAIDFNSTNESLIGDDSAIIDACREKVNLFASDLMAENVHFSRSYFTPTEIGYRAIVTNVSDIAAMGGKPRYVTISLATPKDFDLQAFYIGIKQACKEYDLRVVGGDLSSSSSVFVSVAILGSSITSPITRSGAQAGDYIYITGPTGASSRGLELLRRDPRSKGTLQDCHKLPKARIAAGHAIAQIPANSAIDVSDGLIADLNHICERSNVGATLTLIPIANGATLEQSLYGGEDYEIIFSHPDKAKVTNAFRQLGCEQPIQIGYFTNSAGISHNGNLIEIRGYQHCL